MLVVLKTEGVPGGDLVPLFPSKIALCSHVPTHFANVLFPCSQKLANVPLFPSIFCQCSLVPFDILPMFPCSPKPLGGPQDCNPQINRICFINLSFRYPSFCQKLLETTFLVRLLLEEKHIFP